MVRIGAREGDPAQLFQRVSGVRILSGGRVAVADRGSRSVRVYSREGALLRELGGEGEGPGEIQLLGHLGVAPGDTLEVYDPDLRRMTRYPPGQGPVETLSTEAPSGRPELVLGRYADGGWAMAWIALEEMDRDPPDAHADPMRLGRFGPGGAFRGPLGRATGLVRQGREGGGAGPVPFSPFFQGVLVDDSVYHVAGTEPGIVVLGEGGEVARTLELDLPIHEPGPARRVLEAALDSLGAGDRLAGIPESAWSRPVPRIAALLAGRDHRLWVKPYDPATDSWLLGSWGRHPGGAWWVVEPDGRVVARVELPDGFMLMDATRERVAGVVVDALGVERVEVRELVR